MRSGQDPRPFPGGTTIENENIYVEEQTFDLNSQPYLTVRYIYIYLLYLLMLNSHL